MNTSESPSTSKTNKNESSQVKYDVGRRVVVPNLNLDHRREAKPTAPLTTQQLQSLISKHRKAGG